MTSFAPEEVRAFVSEVESEMTLCDNGEGMKCATIDATVAHYTTLCRRFYCEASSWLRAVFTGRTPYDAEIEKIFLSAGAELSTRAKELSWHGEKLLPACFELSGGSDLRSIQSAIEAMLGNWTSPQLAVAPAARRPQGAHSLDDDETVRLIESLPPLAANWEPDDQKLRVLFQKAPAV